MSRGWLSFRPNCRICIVPDGAERDGHQPHGVCAEKIHEGVGLLGTTQLLLHGFLHHLHRKSLSAGANATREAVRLEKHAIVSHFNVQFFTFIGPSIDFGHTLKVPDGLLALVVVD